MFTLTGACVCLFCLMTVLQVSTITLKTNQLSGTEIYAGWLLNDIQFTQAFDSDHLFLLLFEHEKVLEREHKMFTDKVEIQELLHCLIIKFSPSEIRIVSYDLCKWAIGNIILLHEIIQLHEKHILMFSYDHQGLWISLRIWVSYVWVYIIY